MNIDLAIKALEESLAHIKCQGENCPTCNREMTAVLVAKLIYLGTLAQFMADSLGDTCGLLKRADPMLYRKANAMAGSMLETFADQPRGQAAERAQSLAEAILRKELDGRSKR